MPVFSRELESFVVVAQERSIRHAAERLNLSASAISRQMALLERDYGVQLLIRLPRGVQLTEQGKLLLSRAEDWRLQENQIRSTLRNPQRDRHVQVRLGVMACLSEYLIARFHDQMASSGFNVDLQIVDENLQPLADRLLRHELDIVVAFNIPRLRRIRTIDAHECRIGLVYAPDHPIGEMVRKRGHPRLADCMDEPLCLPDSSMSFNTKLNAEIARQRNDPHIVLSCNSTALICDFIRRGKGIGFLNWYNVWMDVQAGRLCFAALQNRRLTDTLSICTVSGLRQEPHVQIAVNVLREILKEMQVREGQATAKPGSR